MFSAAIQRLPQLPPEVVHKVLSDIQLVRILHILCAHNLPYLDACVASHPHIGKVLPEDRLSEIKQYFLLYVDLIELHRHPALKRPHIAPLEYDAETFLVKGGTTDMVVYHVTSSVLIKLSQYDPFHAALQPHAPGPIPSLYDVDTTDINSMRYLFDTLNAAEKAMNGKKSEQLKRLATLMQEHPRSLRMLGDRSQEMRRNAQHRIDQLLRLSAQMTRPQILDRCFLAPRYFGMHCLFVVPYDRLLRGFIRVHSRYPELKETWPEMETVMAGIKYMYVRDEAGRYLRTRYTEYAGERARGMRQPRFNDEHVRAEYVEKGARLQPLDERELRWVEAFLRVCAAMRAADEEWWSIHVDYIDVM
ncbi:hypothetical protein APHAL10511_002412 [Amanita phalloides]|nr:hypothetical protein APHAL10511_002412 [Amanita phalloides]